MKVIKIVSNFNEPLAQKVTSFFPRDNEATIKANYIIVSDSKFRLLEFNHVHMHVYLNIVDSSARMIEQLMNEEYYIITKVIKPSEFNPQMDVSVYNDGDIIFFYENPPIPPEVPKKPKFHSGTFNYELSDIEKKKILEAYELSLEEYNTKLEAYENDYNTFMETEGSLQIFGCLGVVINDIIIGKKLEIISDVSYVTTKTHSQFGVLGKLPKEMKTIVGATTGGLKQGTSIKDKKLSDIITKILGLQSEKEIVGEILPNDDFSSTMSKPTIDYGVGKTALGGPNDTATISTTLKLPEDSEVTNVKLVKSKTGEVISTKSVSSPTDTVSFTVTGLTESTSYSVIAYHEADGKEVIDGKTSTTVAVRIIKPSIKLVAIPSSVGNTETAITFTATVTPGSAEITKVELFTDGSETPTNMTGSDNTYTATVSSITETTKFYAVVTDRNTSTAESSKVTVTLTVTGPILTNMTVSPESISKPTTVTVNVTATKGTYNIAKVELYQDDVVIATETSDFSDLSYEVESVDSATTFKFVATDTEGKTAEATKTVAFVEAKPTITSVDIVYPSGKTSVVPTGTVTINVVSQDNGSTPSKVTLYKNSISAANKVGEENYATTVSFTVSGSSSNPLVNGTKYIGVITYGSSKTVQKTSSGIVVEEVTVTEHFYWGDYYKYYTLQPDFNYEAADALTSANFNDIASKYFMENASTEILAEEFTGKDDSKNCFTVRCTVPDTLAQWTIFIPQNYTVEFFDYSTNINVTLGTITQKGTYTDPDTGVVYNIYMSKNYIDYDSQDTVYIHTTKV